VIYGMADLINRLELRPTPAKRCYRVCKGSKNCAVEGYQLDRAMYSAHATMDTIRRTYGLAKREALRSQLLQLVVALHEVRDMIHPFLRS